MNNLSIKKQNQILYLFLAVIVIRIIISFIPSYKVDMGGYKAWSLYLSQNGFRDFYNTYHVVYAPAYMYLLWITGNIASVFSAGPAFHEFLVKTWAVASDIIGGYLIYKIAVSYGKERLGLLLGIIYSLNPGVFFNSSIWGQFDSLPATLLLSVIYYFNSRKKVLGVIMFSLAILTKPQSGLLAPLVLILFFRDFSFKKTADVLRLIYSGISGICIYIVTVIPFYFATPFYINAHPEGIVSKAFYTVGDVFYWIINLYRTSLDDYPYATANAFNFWTLVGGQPVHDGSPFLGFTYAKWGFILLFAILALSLILIIKRGANPFIGYYSAYLILFGSFMFITRMHERYLLPAIIFITVSIIWDSRLWFPMAGISICVLANHWYLYNLSFKDKFWLSNYDTVAMIFAFLTLAVMVYSVYYALRLIRTDDKNENPSAISRKEAL